MRLLFCWVLFILPVSALANYAYLWQWQKSDCQTCAISIRVKAEYFEINNDKVEAFAQALSDHKYEIISIYQSDPQEYNLLAQMALGILGRESKFFTSWRYRIKENTQLGVTLIKAMQIYLAGDDELAFANSRGPTQIKIIPKKIADYYRFTVDDLHIPENAAKATMGILIENLRELKQRAKNNAWEFITPATYVDYLPYIYFGAVNRLKTRTATPDKNMYVQDMKRYMDYFIVYEWPAGILLR